LRVEIYTTRGRSVENECRKKSSFFPNPADHKADLKLSPTNVLFNRVQKADDSYLREWMKGESNL
jgi:hypothetical protein